MTTATVSTTATTNDSRVLGTGLTTGVVAGGATTLFAAAAHGAGVPLEIQGEMIPLLGFAQMTFICTLIGVGIAALCRRGTNARRRFVQITLALTALSFVPDITAPATTATKVALIVSHVVAAAIVIPRLADRLSD